MSDEPASDGESADGPPTEATDRDADTDAPADAAGSPSPGDEASGDPEEWVPFEGLSDEGFLLLFAGLACSMAAITAVTRGQPQPVVVFGAVAGAVALVVFAVDAVSGRVPPLWIHLLVGGGATVAAAFALAGSHWVNAGTFGVAAALVLYRVVDVEFRGAEGPGDAD